MNYEVTAVFPGRGVSRLQLAADSPDQLTALPALQGGVIVSFRCVGQHAARRRGKFPLPLFTRQLLSLLQAGLTVVEGLETLAAQDRGSLTAEVLNSLLKCLREGQSLSAALQQHPQAFPDLYVATVKASERTGDMPEALRRYIVFHEKLADLRKKIVSAAIYPLLLITVGGLVTLFLLGFVVPRFSLVFADSGRDPEGLSSLLFAWGGLINQHAGLLGLLSLLVVGALFFLAAQPAVRALVARPGGLLVTGMAWALLPCGLLYTALLTAALSGSVLRGALCMVLFGVGSAAWLVAGPMLWRGLRARLAGSWGSRLAGFVLFAMGGTALWMDVVHGQPAPWCLP